MDFALDSVRVDGSNSHIHLTPERLHLQSVLYVDPDMDSALPLRATVEAVCLSFSQRENQ
jgi:hypothetical protein